MNVDNIYFLALDFGTESLRAALFNKHGKMIHSKACTYKTTFPYSGWAEQNPDEWWDAFIQVIQALLNASGIRPEQIPSLCIDSTSCTVLALDKHFQPLRNALLWMDVRAFKQAERIAKCGSDSLKYNGFGSVSAEWMPSKVLWLKENQCEIYDHARYICELQDYINYRITGNYVGSINNVTIRWYYNTRCGGWPKQFYSSIGLENIIERFPKKILKLGEPIGTILPNVAKETGLSTSTIVIQGGADAFTGMIGLGVVKQGRVALITGSSHVMLGLSKKEIHKEGIFGAFPDAVIEGLYAVEGSQISTGSVLKWFKDHFINKEFHKNAEKQDLGLYEYMGELASKIKIGSDGLILLNYWQGNRNPITDSQARGAVWGFSLKHTPAHLYRAIMEGIAYGTEYIVRCFREAGFNPEEIYVCGGPTKSNLWMQIHSDVLGIPIFLTEDPNAPLLGDAILASYGAGVFKSLEEAVKSMVRIRLKIEPDNERHSTYRYYVDKYIETYFKLRNLMHDMLQHETMKQSP